jgi:NAD(P)-dependent dehydrogenase (short-subunit alcohol dehydrogenase family)
MENKTLPAGYQASPDLLANRVVLITGAGDGIGKTAALTYARHGATVILLGRTVAKLETVYDEIVAEKLPEPAIVPADMGSLGVKTLAEISEVIDERYGRLDGLLHNAAILGERVPVEHYDLQLWDEVMQVNFNGVVMLTRFLLPQLRQSKQASLIFTSSGVGVTPRAYWGPYAISKYALEGFAQLLASELENTSDIRVSVLNPGATRTRMRALAYPSEDPQTLKTSDELMPLYLYLMGPDSDTAHGHRFAP